MSLDPTTILQPLIEMGANDLTHNNNKTLLRHLLNTAMILAAEKQPDHVVLAGLYHSVYGTEFYGCDFLSMHNSDHRNYLSEKIGKDAERLVFLYCSLDRKEFMRYYGQPKKPIRFLQDDQFLEVTPEEEVDLMSLFSANEAEHLIANV